MTSGARGWLAWMAAGALACGAARAQAPDPRETLALYLPTDFATARRLDTARDYVRQAAWPEAFAVLQTLLDAEDDRVVHVRDAAGAVAWVGVKAEADRLLAELPAVGRDTYETLNGPRARTLLMEARRTGEPGPLEEATRRYFHTTSGAEAARLLGLHHLDRGRDHLAAGCFGRLLDGNAEMPPSGLLAAALAFRRVGDVARATRAWERLKARAPRSVLLGDRLVPTADVERALPRPRVATARGPGFLPRLEPEWDRATVHDRDCEAWLETAARQEEARPGPVLPGSVPLVVGDRLVYRTARGLVAVDGRTGRRLWDFDSEWGFERLARDLRYHPHVAAWIAGYTPNNPNVLFENATLGTLSTDGTRVYAVEDLPLPPFPAQLTGSRRRDRIPPPPFPPQLDDPARHSRLVALELDTGRLAWEVGGRGADGGPLADCHFLGPPLPLDGRLYAAVEKDLQIRLVCLDAVAGKPLWSQALAVPTEGLLTDVVRRTQAIRPAYADGVLVCPTNAGVLVGVDPGRRGIAWAYPYREDVEPDDAGLEPGRRVRSRPRNLPRLRAEWRAAAPVVSEGRILFTAPDTAALHCLNLRTGRLLWKANRADGELYLAGVHGGRALLVGRDNCRALRLSDGQPAWSVATGLPSGQGVLAGGTFYLPLADAGSDTTPAVVAVDVERGTVAGRAVVEDGEALGNVVFAGDLMFSQTVTGLAAYPREEAGR